MSKASLDRFHQVHKPAVLMVGLPAYVAALDDLMFATRHKSRVSLVAACSSCMRGSTVLHYLPG